MALKTEYGRGTKRKEQVCSGFEPPLQDFLHQFRCLTCQHDPYFLAQSAIKASTTRSFWNAAMAWLWSFLPKNSHTRIGKTLRYRFKTWPSITSYRWDPRLKIALTSRRPVKMRHVGTSCSYHWPFALSILPFCPCICMSIYKHLIYKSDLKFYRTVWKSGQIRLVSLLLHIGLYIGTYKHPTYMLRTWNITHCIWFSIGSRMYISSLYIGLYVQTYKWMHIQLVGTITCVSPTAL